MVESNSTQKVFDRAFKELSNEVHFNRIKINFNRIKLNFSKNCELTVRWHCRGKDQTAKGAIFGPYDASVAVWVDGSRVGDAARPGDERGGQGQPRDL